MKKHVCNCEVCKAASKLKITESDLHLFVGAHRANFKCGFRAFEDGLTFASVTHWDVGYSEAARYYIYRNDVGSSIAWYDVITNSGYKHASGRIFSQQQH